MVIQVSDTTLKELDDPRLNNDVLRRKNLKKRVTKNDLIPREVNLLSALKTFDSWHDTQSSIAMSTHFWSFKLDQYVTKKQNCWFHDLEKLDTLWFKYPNIFKSRYNFVSPNDISHYHTTVQYIFCSSANLWITIQCASHHWIGHLSAPSFLKIKVLKN